jgi:hypothetical protein
MAKIRGSATTNGEVSDQLVVRLSHSSGKCTAWEASLQELHCGFKLLILRELLSLTSVTASDGKPWKTIFKLK